MMTSIFLLIASVLVIFMNAGFGMLETGFCRQKNAVNSLSKNLIVLAIAFYGFTPKEKTQKTEISTTEIQWMSLEQALQANQKHEKKIFIDMYTSWCGWCKVMDQKTFTDPEVIRYINENFYAVKFDAEQKTPITYKGKKYEFIPTGRRGIHALAYELLNRNASYPSFVLLDENLTRIGILKGFKKPVQFLELLKSKVTI